MEPNPHGWGSLARLVGSVLYGRYPDDARARKRAATLTVGAALTTVVSVVYLDLVRPMIRDQVQAQPARDAAMLAAIEKMTDIAKSTERAVVQVTAAVEQGNARAEAQAKALSDIASAIGVRRGYTESVPPARVSAKPAPMESR